MALSIRWLLSGANYIFVYFPPQLGLGPRTLCLLAAVKVVFSSFRFLFLFLFIVSRTNNTYILAYGFWRSLKSLIVLHNALERIALMGYRSHSCFLLAYSHLIRCSLAATFAIIYLVFKWQPKPGSENRNVAWLGKKCFELLTARGVCVIFCKCFS